jgi:hypothetical protein
VCDLLLGETTLPIFPGLGFAPADSVRLTLGFERLVLCPLAVVMRKDRMVFRLFARCRPIFCRSDISAADLLTRDIWYLMESFQFRIRLAASLAGRFSRYYAHKLAAKILWKDVSLRRTL